MRRKGVPIDSVNKKDAKDKVYASYFLNKDYKWRKPVGSAKPVSPLLQLDVDDTPVTFNKYRLSVEQSRYGSPLIEGDSRDHISINVKSLNGEYTASQCIMSIDLKEGVIYLPNHCYTEDFKRDGFKIVNI
jgi:hypothetical protein